MILLFIYICIYSNIYTLLFRVLEMIILDVCFTSRIAAQFLHPRLVVHIFFGTSVDLGTKPTLDIDPGNTLSNQQNLPRRL